MIEEKGKKFKKNIDDKMEIVDSLKVSNTKNELNIKALWDSFTYFSDTLSKNN